MLAAVFVACAGSPQPPAPAPRASAPPAPIDARAPDPRVTLVLGVAQPVPGTDVVVTLLRTLPGEPRTEMPHGFAERVWPSAWLELRRGDATESVRWRAGWNDWQGARWRVEIDEGDRVTLTRATAPAP